MSAPLQQAIDAELCRHEFPPTGRIACYRAEGAGPPVLLLHSINAAPSAFEVRPLFEGLRGERELLAPDLPGFGHSDRPDRDYTPELFAEAIGALAADLADEPVDVVALSTTAEFAARAALGNPRIRSLALVSPTGLMGRPPPGPKAQARIESIVQTPVLGRGLYRLLTTRASIRYFLGKAFYGPIPDGMVDYAVATTRLPGAEHAPFCFLSMRLFDADAVEHLYRRVEQPVLVLYDEDPNVGFERLPEVLALPNWRGERIAPSRGLPHFEHPERTLAALKDFWGSMDG